MQPVQALTRRPVLTGLAALLTSPLLRATGAYPVRPIRLLVGYAPASGADVVARLIAAKMTERLAQPMVVENRPGAGGVIASQEFVRAPADGYTLMLGAMPQIIISYAANPKLPHPLRDFAPVSQIVSADLVLITNPQLVPAANLIDFIAWAQKQPINFLGTPGPGTVGHFLSTMLADSAKAKIEPVHFKTTGDSVTALLGGQVHALFVTYTVADALAKSKRVLPLAVTGAARSPLFLDTPTMNELGHPELEAGSWYGVLAPANTPPEIVDQLSTQIVDGAKAPAVRSKLEEAGMRVTALNRDDFARGMKEDLAKWEKVVKSTGFKLQA